MSPFFECSIVIAIVILLMVFVGAPVGRRAKQWMKNDNDCIWDDILTGVLAMAVIVVAAAVLAVVCTAIMFGIISVLEGIVKLFQ